MRPPRVEAAAELSLDGKLLGVCPPRAARALLYGPAAAEPQAVAGLRQLRAVVLGASAPKRGWDVFARPGEVAVFAPNTLSGASRRWLEQRAELHLCPQDGCGIGWVLSVLGKRFSRVAWGGGTSLLRALAEEGFLSHLGVRFMPEICGGADTPTLLGVAGKCVLTRSIQLRLESAHADGGELRVRYAVARRSGPRTAVVGRTCGEGTQELGVV